MPTKPIHIFARWKVKAGNLETVLKLLQQVRTITIEEKGNLFYTIHQSVQDANTLFLYEGYVNEVAQQEHVHSSHYQKLVAEQIIPLLEEREVHIATPIENA